MKTSIFNPSCGSHAFSATLLVSLFIAMFTLAAPDLAFPEEAPAVNVIEIRGLKRIDEASVRTRISHGIGEPLSSERASADIREIYKMGYFDDVRVEVEPFEGGVKLIYIVREKPVITRIAFDGNKKIKEKQLRELLTITPGSIADTILIQRNADQISAYYSSKGYTLAVVVPVIRRVSEEQAVLTYQIQENQKVKIKKVVIVGNKKISARKIRGVMKTSKWSVISFLTKGGYYEKNKMEQDLKAIKDLYFDNGYIQAAVSEPQLELSDDRTKMTITIHVSEGEQFKVAKISIRGNTEFTEEALRDKLSSGEGKVFSKGKLEKDVKTFTDMYGERGYAASTVVPEIIPDEEAKEVDISLGVNEGDIYSIGRISITGNIRTRDKVIRREVRLVEGDTFNGKLLRRSYERINNTNFFEEVKLEPRIRQRVKKVDLNIDVKERKTGSISFGVGYSTLDNFVTMAEFIQGNLAGRGQSLKVRAELGSSASFYTVSFTEPWFLGKPVAFSTSIYSTEREYVDYDRKATGLTFGFSKEFWEYYKAGILYKLEKADITNVSATASTLIKSQEGEAITSSVTPSLLRDTTDNVLDPHRGTRHSIKSTFAGLGGDNKFWKLVLDSQIFFPVTERTTFTVRGRYGHSAGLAGEEVPLYERFYVGGIHTIRGLDFGEGGPRDDNGQVIGGKDMLIFNVEYIFPIAEKLRFNGVVFFDAGSAFNGNFEKFRYTTGAGIRWISPMGPLRLEWGYNLDPQLDEKQSRFDFSIGSFF